MNGYSQIIFMVPKSNDFNTPIPYIKNMEEIELEIDEEFVPRDASILVYKDESSERIEDNTIYIDTVDEEEKNVTLQYSFNYVLVEDVEYDIPDEEVTFTTQPENVERVQLFEDNDMSLIFDGVELKKVDVADLTYEHADDIEFTEDYVVIRGFDESEDPIPTQFEAYFVLSHVYVNDELIWNMKMLTN